MQVTVKHLKYIAGGSAPLAAEFASAFNNHAEQFGFTNVNRVVEFLAQIAVENRFQYRKEIWGPTAAQIGYDFRSDLGNDKAGDGKKYMGRGPIQITGKANYRDFTAWLRKTMPGSPDFVRQPQLLEQLEWGILAAFWFWTTRKLNTLADQGNTRAITKKINGGYNHLAERQAAAKRGYTVITNETLGIAPGAEQEPALKIEAPIPVLDMMLNGNKGMRPEREDAPTPTKEKLRMVQRVLFEKGYKDVGDDDGIWGRKTSDSLTLFRKDHDLEPKSGYAKIDADLLDALFESDGRNANSDRSGLRLPQIAAKVPELLAANIAKKISGVGVVAAGVPGIIGTIAAGIPDARALLDPIINAVNFTMPTWGWLVLLTAVSGATLFFSRKSERASVDAYRNGERNAQS
jgi:putative chitinase